MMLARCDNVFRHETSSYLTRPLMQAIQEQVYVTTSGLFTLPPFAALLATFGIDHVMYSVDYPFSTNEVGQAFLKSLPLAPHDLEKVAHSNADRLLKLKQS